MTFLSRDQIESRLVKRVDDFERGYRQNVALLARPGLGRTRFMTRLMGWAQPRASLLSVFISLEDVSSSHLTAYWIRSLLSSALALPEAELDFLLDAADQSLPKTAKACRHVLKLQKQGNTHLAVRELFGLAGQLAEERACKVVLILDELLGLEKFLIPDIYSVFGNRMMMEKEVLFIVTSSDPHRARKIFSEKLALLFSNFEILDLQPFGFHEMNLFLNTRVCGPYLSMPARRFLFRLTDGEPCYLEILLRAFDESVCLDPQKQIGVAALFETVIREVLEEDGRIALQFQGKVAALRRPLRERKNLVDETVALLGGGRLKPGVLAATLGLKLVDAKKMILRMEEENWLIASGSSYTLRDSLFRFWAREALAPACLGQLMNVQLRRSRWSRRLGEIYEMGLESDTERLAGQFEAALKLFRSESVRLSERKIPGIHFNEISCFHGTDHRWFIKALASKEDRYFQLVAGEEAREADVESLRLLPARPRKKAKRILVATQGIEQNAKLLAQQNKIEIWDLHFLNQVFDFYGLPKMIMEKKSSVWDDRATSWGAQSLFGALSG